jgi:MoaA/NifB/PqqE/SkfB family radical SAM enzyme
MDFDLYKRIVKEMRDAGVQEIGMFFLGESFMNVDLLVNAIKYAKDIGIPYTFCTTNGSLCSSQALMAVMDAGLDSLKFSINAASVDQFERLMGVKSKNMFRCFDNIAEANSLRISFGYNTKIYASSIQYEGAQQKEMEKVLEEYVYPYVDEHYWLPLYSMGAFATQREEELGYRPTAGNQGRLGALREPLPCWSAFMEGHVRADGGLSACCFDAGGNWIMGDLTKQSFMEAWNSERFVQLRQAHLCKNIRGTVCENCVAYGG